MNISGTLKHLPITHTKQHCAAFNCLQRIALCSSRSKIFTALKTTSEVKQQQQSMKQVSHCLPRSDSEGEAGDCPRSYAPNKQTAHGSNTETSACPVTTCFAVGRILVDARIFISEGSSVQGGSIKTVEGSACG
jgi:hypothetical protein